MKRFHKLLGQEGERYAEEYLKKCGYTFVARNFRAKHAEIDLIFTHETDLVFVEVKTMTEQSQALFGAPSQKVDRNKRRRNSLAAAIFLQKHRATFSDFTPRFDVMEVTVCARELKFSHIKHAFPAEFGFQKKKLF